MSKRQKVQGTLYRAVVGITVDVISLRIEPGEIVDGSMLPADSLRALLGMTPPALVEYTEVQNGEPGQE